MQERFYNSPRGDCQYLTRYMYAELQHYGPEYKQEIIEDLADAWVKTAHYIYEKAQQHNVPEPVALTG